MVQRLQKEKEHLVELSQVSDVKVQSRTLLYSVQSSWVEGHIAAMLLKGYLANFTQ